MRNSFASLRVCRLLRIKIQMRGFPYYSVLVDHVLTAAGFIEQLQVPWHRLGFAPRLRILGHSRLAPISRSFDSAAMAQIAEIRFSTTAEPHRLRHNHIAASSA